MNSIGVHGSSPSVRARSMRARSSWFFATSSAPTADTSWVRARVTSIAALTPAFFWACASPTRSAATAESAWRAVTCAATRATRR